MCMYGCVYVWMCESEGHDVILSQTISNALCFLFLLLMFHPKHKGHETPRCRDLLFERHSCKG